MKQKILVTIDHVDKTRQEIECEAVIEYHEFHSVTRIVLPCSVTIKNDEVMSIRPL